MIYFFYTNINKLQHQTKRFFLGLHDNYNNWGDRTDIYFLKIILAITNIIVGEYIFYYCWEYIGLMYFHPGIFTELHFPGQFWPLAPDQYNLFLRGAWNAYLYICGDLHSRANYYIADPYLHHNQWRIDRFFYICNVIIFSYCFFWLYCWFWLIKQIYLCFPPYLKNFLFYLSINLTGITLIICYFILIPYLIYFFLIRPFDEFHFQHYYDISKHLINAAYFGAPLPEDYAYWPRIARRVYPIERTLSYINASILGILIILTQLFFTELYLRWVISRIYKFFMNIKKIPHLWFKSIYLFFFFLTIIPLSWKFFWYHDYPLHNLIFLFWPLFMLFNYHRLSINSRIVYILLNCFTIFFYFDITIQLMYPEQDVNIFNPEFYQSSILYYHLALFYLWFSKFVHRLYLLITEQEKME